MKLKIKGKILLYILGLISIIYIGFLVYFGKNIYKTTSERAKKTLQAVSYKHLNYVKYTLSSFTDATSTLALSLEEIKTLPEHNRRPFVIKKLNQIIDKNPEYLSVWSIWEPYSIDNFDSIMEYKPGSTYKGNFCPGFFRVKNEIQMEKNEEITELFVGDYYTIPKNCLCPVIMEPYNYSYTHKKEDEVLQTNLIYPIIIDSNFMGVIGIDASLKYLYDKLGKVTPLNSGQIYIISNKGKIVSCPDSSFINKNISDFLPNITKKYNVKEKIKNGEYFEISDFNKYLNKKSFFIFEPLVIGKTKTPWSFCVSIPNKTLYKQANKSFVFIIFIGLIGVIILLIAMSLYSNYLSKLINKIKQALFKLKIGNTNVDNKIKHRGNDEINKLIKSINKLFESINASVLFAKEIGKGNLDAEYKFLSANDELGQSLVNMQNSLKKAKIESEKKKVVEQNRNWVTRGLAKFGEIIRQNNDNMELFAQHVIKEFVSYIDVAQAALFITETVEGNEGEGDEKYVLKAAMAYNKPIIFEKSTQKGYELLGRAADSGKILHLKKIPQEYVQITPGKKDAKRPNNLLISPLIFNSITYGLLEIVSYDPFLPHHIEFIETLSENIASVISSVQTNIKTSKLLKKSHEQGEVLSQHEEEMRQNLEELQATQEESQKRESILGEKIRAFKQSIMSAELDINGRVLSMTPSMLSHYGFTFESIREKYFEGFIAQTQESRDKFSKFWDNLMKKDMNVRTQVIRKQNKEIVTQEYYQVINKDLMQAKVLLIAIDITKEKELKEELKEKTQKK